MRSRALACATKKRVCLSKNTFSIVFLIAWMRRAGDTQKAPRSGLKHLLQRVLIPPHPSLNLVCAPFSPLEIPCFVRYHCKKFSVRSIWSFPGAVPNSCFRQSSPAPSKNLVCAPTDQFSVRPPPINLVCAPSSLSGTLPTSTLSSSSTSSCFCSPGVLFALFVLDLVPRSV